MSRVTRFAVKALILVVVLGLLAACGPAATKPTETPVLKIGAALSLSGGLAREGEMLKKGYELFVEAVNEKGGLKVGSQQYKVELVYYDDKSEAETSAKLTEKLITEDKVAFLFGPYSSGLTLATSLIGEKYNIITMAAMASADPVYERGLKNTFSVLTLASHEIDPFVDLAYKMTGGKGTVGILTPDSMYPLYGAEGAKRHAEGLGMPVVYYQKYAADLQDFYPILTELKQANPDVIVMQCELGHAITVIKQMKDLDINPKMVWTYALEIADFTNGLGSEAEYIYGTTYFARSLGWKDPLFGDTAGYMDAFEKKYGYTPSHYEGAATAAGTILMQALEKAGSLETDKVRTALLSISGQSELGPFKMEASGQNTAGTTVIVQRQGGTNVMVWPEAVKKGEVIYPMPNWKDR